MKLITIQHKKVLETLKSNKTYIATFENKNTPSNLITSYKNMMSHYNYKNVPVFCGVIDRYAEFYGATTENAIILELDVPDEFIKLQVYYDWSDLIYFIEFPAELEDISLDEFTNLVLNGIGTDDADTAIQATIPYIKPEWLVNSYKLTEKFIDLHVGSGGGTILTKDSYI